MMRLVLADDSTAVRAALRALLERLSDIEVVGEAENGQEACALAESTGPDVILMDVHMPVMDGVEAAHWIGLRYPRIRIVAMTSFDDAASVSAMIGAGASGYLLKTAPPHRLLAGLQALQERKPAIDPDVLPQVLRELGRLYREERARADALEEVDRFKREFLALVSDELRTPLTSITGFARTMRHDWERLDDATRRDFVGSIDDQAARLSQRIDLLLAVAQFEQESTSTPATACDLSVVVREVLERMAEALAGRSLDVRTEPTSIMADRTVVAAAVLALMDAAAERLEGDLRLRIGDGHLSIGGLPTPGAGPEAPLALVVAERLLAVIGGRLEVAMEGGQQVFRVTFGAG